MSEINALTGQAKNAPATVQASHGPQVNFNDPTGEKSAESDFQAQMDSNDEYYKLAKAASMTKFATGNPETDIRNFLKMKDMVKELNGMLGRNDY